jgi:hypothetical protein
MNKVGVTLLLRKYGVPLSEAHGATDALLRGQAVSVYLPAGTNIEAVRRNLDDLGVVT